MEVWFSSESATRGLVARSEREISNQIEKEINNYLKEIGYKNDTLDILSVIFVLRNDDVFDEIWKYRPKKRDTDIRPKIDYEAFVKGDETTRKRLIYEALLRAIDFLKSKKVKNLEPLEEYVHEQIALLE